MKDKKGVILGVIGVLCAILIIGLVMFFLLRSGTYKVTFMDNGNIDEVEVKSGNMVDEKKVDDEHFLGWFEDGYNSKFDFTQAITRDYTLVAKYDEKYKVVFNSDGGSSIATQEVYANEKAVEPTTPTKNGMVFVEWQLDGEKYDFEEEVTANITLKAIWKESDGTYTVIFNSDGGSKVANASVKINKTVKKPANPTRRGYDFVEWQLDGETYDFNSAVTSDITLVAVWKEKEQVKVTFVSDGKTIKTINVGKGDTLGSVPANPTKDGYVFDGWYDNTTEYTTKTVIKAAVTLTAKFITVDQSYLRTQLNTIKSSKLSMEKGSDNIASQIKTSNGCSVRAVNVPATIERGSKDSVISVEFAATCGEETGSQKVNVTVKASPYKYTKVANSNMLNYDVSIVGGSWDSDGKLFLGQDGSFNVISRKAVVENAKIESNPTFKLRFNNDATTLYTVTFKG